MNRHSPHPEQLPVAVGDTHAKGPMTSEQIIKAHHVTEAERDAIRWRLRLVVIESIMMTALLLGAGIAMHHGPGTALRNAVLVGLACLLTGVLLILLSAATSRAVTHLCARCSITRKSGRADK